MSVRTFTVFQDVPSSDNPKPKTISTSATITVLTSTTNSVTPNHATLTTAEKENVHPVTGERAGPNNIKKRKTTVLATKIHIPLAGRKQKESTETQPDAKKRKSSSSSTTSTVKGKGNLRKEGKSRKGKKAPSRKVSPMPKLDEEVDTADREHTRVTQADIDSRCYELTVKPLADVSQAYEQSTSFEIASSCNENVKFRAVKASSVEPEIRDYYAPPQGSSLPTGSTNPPSSPSHFSTPERKQIYAAFTFTSPSPTSERFSKVTRLGSAPRLELV